MTKAHVARFASLTLLLLVLGIFGCCPGATKGTVVGTVKDPNDALVTTAEGDGHESRNPGDS